MPRTNIHGRVSSENDDDLCCFAPTIAHQPANFDSKNNQTWSQLFANCSYQRNSSGNYSAVCHGVYEPVSTFFLTGAFLLALVLLLFNLATVIRKVTRTELIIRTIMHMIYAVILSTTALTYALIHHSCSNCKGFVYLSFIPMPTTLCMVYNWHDCNERVQLPHPQRRRSPESQLFQLELERFATDRFPSTTGRIVSSRPSSAIPRPPTENDTNPQLENEFNDWLEAEQQRR